MSDEIRLIESVLNGEVNSVRIPRKKLNTYVIIIDNLLGDPEREWETNGHAVDFWVTFFGEDTNYILFGDLWYEDEFRFYREEKMNGA